MKNDNRPDLVRTNFLNYLRSDFVHKQAWTHPVTKEEFPYGLIYDKVMEYKRLDNQNNNGRNYELLYANWASNATRYRMAQKFSFSSSSVKRRWNASIDCILLMLQFPELEPSIPHKLHKVPN